MRKLITFLTLVVGLITGCPGQSRMDTVEVSRGYKTILIFPEAIAESIVGNELGYVANVPKPNGNQYHSRLMKLYYDDLVSEDIPYTNLHVITATGFVYDFMLKLTERPTQLTWYIDSTMAAAHMDRYNETTAYDVGHHMPKIQESISETPNGTHSEAMQTTTTASHSITRRDSENPTAYIEAQCARLQFDKARIQRYFSRAEDLFLWLKGIYYNGNEMYFQFRIANNEGLDLDINFIKFHLATNYKNSRNHQRRELRPIFTYKQPQTVPGKSENHFIVVFEKFALDVKKEFVVELDEDTGSRNLSMAIGHELINNPIPFEP